MGVFGDWAEKYFDLGINVIPIAFNKIPPKGLYFKKWLDAKQTEDDIEKLIEAYGHCPGIGVVCGKVSGIVGFDFDYKFDPQRCAISKEKLEKDKAVIEAQIRSALPEWRLAKKAKEGWTSFYKFSPNLKTVACDRNGIRLFDFKSSGYIVIPPSLHSVDSDKKEIFYSWICGDPMEDFKDLPEIDLMIVEDLAATFSNGSSKLAQLKSHRHGRIFLFATHLCKIEPDTKKIAKAMIEYDLKIHSKDQKGLYFKDKKHTGHNAQEFAEKWAERIKSNSKHFDKIKDPESLALVYDHFFSSGLSEQYGQPVKDILTEKIFYRHPVEKRFVQGEDILSTIKSYGAMRGLKRAEIQDEFERFQLEFSKKDFLVKIPEHDGHDYLLDHVARLKSPNFSTQDLYEIFLNWGHHLFAKIYDSNIQNRCIILKGNQGIGKDDWIKSMCADFGPYYAELTMRNDQAEIMSAVQKKFISHLSEFDQTSKTGVAFLKALITNATSYMREKYARVATDKPMRASWISSVNVDDMFQDPTGNRRFVVIPLEKIEWDYPRNGMKILSQFLDAYRQGIGKTVSQPVEDKIKIIVDALTPENISDDLVEVIEYRLASIQRAQPNFRVPSHVASSLFADIAKTYGISVQKVYSLAKRFKKRSNGVRYYSSNTPQ